MDVPLATNTAPLKKFRLGNLGNLNFLRRRLTIVGCHSARALAWEPHMDKVSDLVRDRSVIYSVDVNSSVLEAARFMMEHNIGAVPVLREGELAGIFSERDIMNRVVAAGRMPGTTKVSEVMTSNPRAVGMDETIENCLFLMREFGFRHVPICEGKKLKGLVSLRDIMLRKREPVRA